MDKLLDGWEKIKKDKHGQDFYDQRKHFYLFVLLVDRMMVKEAQVILAALRRLIAAKIDESILHVTGWFYGRI